MTRRRFPKVLILAVASAIALGAASSATAFEVQCGAEGGDAFGWSVASGADFNGDGKLDIAVGGPCAWVGSSMIRAGRVRIYSGKNGAVLLSLAGTDAEQRLGSSLDWIPDLNGDGRAELVIGSAGFSAPKQSGGTLLGAGKVEVRSSTGGVLWTAFGTSVNATFGETLGVVPDVNGDGKAEVAVGASGAVLNSFPRGAAYLLSGATGAQLAQNNGSLEGELWGSLAGHAGDLNGDGTADWFASTRIAELAVENAGVNGGETSTTTSTSTTTTTTLAPRAGRLSVMSGLSPYGVLQTFRGMTLVDRLGRAAVPAGDVNGDDLGDLWIGSVGAEPSMLDDAGTIALYSGTGELIREITEPTPQQSALFGTSLVRPGSLDGGDVDDVVAGAPNGRVSQKNQVGRLHAFAGEDGELLWSKSGTLALERFGQSLSSGFDFNGDGVVDVLVGAPGDSPGGKRGAGSAVVLSGATGEELQRLGGRRGRETRIFVAGPDLARQPTVRAFDSYSHRREAESRPFRGQLTTQLSLAVLNGGRRDETQNGFKTMLVVGTGKGGARPEVTVYGAARRRRQISRFAAGPEDYAGGLNVGAGNFFVDAGDEIAVVPSDASGVDVLAQVYRGAALPDPISGRISWILVREFTVFLAADKVNNITVNAVGANLAAGEFTGDEFDEIVATPASGLPVVRVLGRTGTLIKEWQAFDSPGDGSQPNSGVSVAVGDLDGEGELEIVTAPAVGQPAVRAWKADGTPFEHSPGQPVNFAVTDFGVQFGGGLAVAAADVDLDGRAEILVAPGAGAVARILAFEADGSPVQGWQAYQPFGPLAIHGVGLFGLDQFWRR